MSAPLMIRCPECEGHGEQLTDAPPRGRYVRCGHCAGEGTVEAECDCGDVAEVLAGGEPRCAVCAEDYEEGPVPMERAPWQQDINHGEGEQA